MLFKLVTELAEANSLPQALISTKFSSPGPYCSSSTLKILFRGLFQVGVALYIVSSKQYSEFEPLIRIHLKEKNT